MTNTPEGDNLPGPSSPGANEADLQKCVTNHAALNGVCVMLAKKIKQSKEQTALESAKESHDKSVQSSSAEERPFQKVNGVYCEMLFPSLHIVNSSRAKEPPSLTVTASKPVIGETQKKGTSGADETKGLFDGQGRLLCQRVVVIGGPGRPIVREQHHDQTSDLFKMDDKLHSSTSKGEKSKNSSSTCSSANCKSILKKSSGSDSENEGLKKDSEAVTSVPTKRSKKSVCIIAPASSGEDQKEGSAGSGAAVKVGKAIPKSARDLITTLLKFVGELEDTTIKSNTMREKNVLNEYRGLVQLFLISQAGLMLAFALLTIFLVNVFALLFIVVVFVSR